MSFDKSSPNKTNQEPPFSWGRFEGEYICYKSEWLGYLRLGLLLLITLLVPLLFFSGPLDGDYSEIFFFEFKFILSILSMLGFIDCYISKRSKRSSRIILMLSLAFLVVTLSPPFAFHITTSKYAEWLFIIAALGGVLSWLCFWWLPHGLICLFLFPYQFVVDSSFRTKFFAGALEWSKTLFLYIPIALVALAGLAGVILLGYFALTAGAERITEFFDQTPAWALLIIVLLFLILVAINGTKKD